jgi:tetratricopeptide (TPR) repeat protein
MATRDRLTELRDAARDAYSRGALDEAIGLQQLAIASARETAALAPDDILFLGLMLYAGQRVAGGIEALREGAALFPDHASIHENMAVFLLAAEDLAGAIAESKRAVELGSNSPNVHDCLCDAYARIGRIDEACAAGKAALEAKDRMFGGRAPLTAVPAGTPPPFNPLVPSENVIAYCLWGGEHRYLVPLMENIRILPHVFPGWTLRLYHDTTVPPDYLAKLANAGAQLVRMALPGSVPEHRKLLWRFEVISDPAVRRFLIRDADSVLSVKERVAVDAWLQSRRYFHAMRDWYSHTDLLLAGMWGGVGNILPPTATLMQSYTAWRVENNHIDQDVLSETVWPTIRHSCLIHDSIFTGCLGSVPFPPFGDNPPGRHIGQNAFLHFRQN